MSVTLTVEGMSCDGCEQTVEALRDVDGVESVAVDRTNNSATVDGEAEPRVLVTAVEDAGYTANQHPGGRYVDFLPT
ncbi:heavy metal transporter [Halobacteriales archaeon QS_8_69_73]|nr:MAG: heavy metal transporter [Halobacteriales archaeon QS_8_69_73]